MDRTSQAAIDAPPVAAADMPAAATTACTTRIGLWCPMDPRTFGLLPGDPVAGGIRVIADVAAVPGCVTAENARGQRFPVRVDAIDRAAAPGTPPLWHKAWSPPYAEVHHWLAGPEWRAVLVADDAWSAELRRAFGERARDRRYDADDSSHPPACRRARAHLAVAREIAEACCPISKPARRLPVRPGAETEEARMVAEILAALAGQPAPGASSDDPGVEAEVRSDDRTFEVPFAATIPRMQWPNTAKVYAGMKISPV